MDRQGPGGRGAEAGAGFFGNGADGYGSVEGGGYSGGGTGEGGGRGGSSFFSSLVLSGTTFSQSGENFSNGLVTLSLESSGPPPSATPETSTWLLFGTGVGLMGLMAARKNKGILTKI